MDYFPFCVEMKRGGGGGLQSQKTPRPLYCHVMYGCEVASVQKCVPQLALPPWQLLIDSPHNNSIVNSFDNLLLSQYNNAMWLK